MADTGIKKVALLIETSTSYGRSLIRGIVQYANSVASWYFYNEPRGFQDKLPNLTRWNLDGIIMRDSEENMDILRLNLPTIVSIRYQKNVPGVTNIIGDSSAIGKMAAKYFQSKGFKHFAYCGFKEMPWSSDRGEAFLNAISLDQKTYLYETLNVKNDYDQEIRHIASWLKKLPKPLALMACNDVRGSHVIEACKMAKIRVPQQVAVLGVNNDNMICDLTFPLLSSIALNIENAGYEAAKRLDFLMNHAVSAKDISDIIIKPQRVFTRQSTDFLAIDDVIVAEAIHFITSNFRHPIQVDDVVRHVNSNRRTLERKFKQTVKKTIYHEIKRIRIDLMSKMLLDTDLSISEIAHQMGFEDNHHISRYFKSAKGILPHQFRKLNRRA